MNKRAHHLLAIAGFVLASAALSARADSLTVVPVQGYLTASDDTPVDGDHRLTFTLFDAEMDGTLLATDDFKSVKVTNGAFVVYLGGRPGHEIDPALFREHTALWIEIVVDGTEIIQPRTQIGSVPFAGYASACGDASTLEGQTASTLRDWSSLQSVPADIADGDDGFTTEAELTSLLNDNYAPANGCPTDAVTQFGFCIWHEDNGSRYAQTYQQAAATCRSKGGRLCTYAEVAAAWAAGADWCANGWVADFRSTTEGYVSYPIQVGRAGCHGPGLSFDPAPLSATWDANCCKY